MLRGLLGVPFMLGVTKGHLPAIIMAAYPGKDFWFSKTFVSQWLCLDGLIRACRAVSILHSKDIVHGNLNERNGILSFTRVGTFPVLIKFNKHRNISDMDSSDGKKMLKDDL